MSSIIAWFNQEPNVHPHILTVCDSKITSNNGGTLEGAKIFELPIRCRDLTTPQQEIYFSGVIGFAYAGSTLVGFNVYAFLQSAFTNLGGLRTANSLPEARDLCIKAEQALSLYVPTIRSPAEVMLFGYCPRNGTPFIGIVRTVQNNGDISFRMEINTDFENRIQYTILGEHTTEISATLDEEIGCADVENLWYWRKPAKVLRDIIIENRFESIGGNLQINLCFNNRFDSYALFTQTEAQQVGIKFRNIDFTEDLMGNVGECNISLGAYMVERPH